MEPAADILGELRSAVADGLLCRLPELQEAALAATGGSHGESQLQGAEIRVMLESMVTMIRRLQPPPRLPSVVVEAARRGARLGVRNEALVETHTVLHRLVWAAILEQVRCMNCDTEEQAFLLRQISDPLIALLGRVVQAIASEYVDSSRRMRVTHEERSFEIVGDVLSGRVVETAELAYDLDAMHVGLVACGKNAREVVRSIASSLDRIVLVAARGPEPVWAWLGGRRAVPTAGIKRVAALSSAHAYLAVGEPASGVAGFRLTHRQAQRARLVQQRRPARVTRFADVMLEAAALVDEELARSMVDTVLGPIDSHRNAIKWRATLEAYFRSQQKVACAAQLLHVDPRTVQYRLSAIEQRMGVPIPTRQAELEVALRLRSLLAAPLGVQTTAPPR